MGIPSYFRTILQNHPSAHYWRENIDTDRLFVDFNSIIYGQLGKISESDYQTKTTIQIDNLVVKYTVQYLQKLICSVVRPKKMVYIAFDGTVPLAKMVQSRGRRFKSASESTNNSCPSFNKIKISPGTKFMAKMSKHIECAIRSGKFSKHLSKTDTPIEFILSDTRIPGEGEHKYMDLLKSSGSTHVDTVYSPDADVIVLLISICKGTGLRVIRPPMSELEREKYPNSDFIYVDIHETKKAILNGDVLSITTNSDSDIRSVLDYVFLTALEGNDFVTPISYLAMRKDQMRSLSKSYNRIKSSDSQSWIVNLDGSINFYVFATLLADLASTEQKKLQDQQKKMHRIRKERPAHRFDRESEMETHDIAVSRHDHEEYYSRFNPEYSRHNHKFDKINYFKDAATWKRQFYGYFGVKNVDTLCTDYLMSLNFTMQYYINGRVDWNYAFSHRCAPFASDLCEYIRRRVPTLPTTIELQQSNPFTPLQQLFMIVPPAYSDLLPKTYAKLQKSGILASFFPTEFELDVVAGEKYIYSEPILPHLDAPSICKELASAKLTKAEIERNETKIKPIIVSK